MGLFFQISAHAESELSRKLVTDELVENLDCASLTLENVLSFITPTKRKAKIETIGVLRKNFVSPGMPGQCWAITKAHRRALYLLSVEETPKALDRASALSEISKLRELRDEFLNMVRGTELRVLSFKSNRELRDVLELSRTPLDVNSTSIPVNELSNGDWMHRNADFFPKTWELAQRRNQEQKQRDLEIRILNGRMALEKLKIDTEMRTLGKDDEGFRSREFGVVDEKYQTEIAALPPLATNLNEAGEISDASNLSGGFLKSSIDDLLVERQKELFFRPSNIRFLIPTFAGKKENSELKDKILRDLSQGRMPILNLRIQFSKQHIVMVQSFSKLYDDSVEFNVFDSNEPLQRERAYLKDKNGVELFAPIEIQATRVGVLKYKNGVFSYDYQNRPIDVFPVDDEEMDEIQNELFRYYHQRCE